MKKPTKAKPAKSTEAYAIGKLKGMRQDKWNAINAALDEAIKHGLIIMRDGAGPGLGKLELGSLAQQALSIRLETDGQFKKTMEKTTAQEMHRLFPDDGY
jgi:hypothetical protein